MISAFGLLKALVEPVRIRLYLLLKQSPLTVSELSEILELSQSNTSHHLKALRELGFLRSEKISQHTFYGLAEIAEAHKIAPLLKQLEALKDEIPEAASDTLKLRSTLAARGEDSFKLWRREQGDLPYSDVFAHLAAGRRGTVADIGCGEGDFFAWLDISFVRIIAVDRDSAHTRAAARKNYKQAAITIVQADAVALPFADAFVDAVVLRMALAQINDYERALGEAVRILKPDGFISIIDTERTLGGGFKRRVREALGDCGIAIDSERDLPQLFMLRGKKT